MMIIMMMIIKMMIIKMMIIMIQPCLSLSIYEIKKCILLMTVDHSVLIKPATLEVRHFLNLTSRTVLLFFLVLYVIVEQSAALILWICSLLIPP